ncbi:MAG: GNAT family N-acetyltransferase [Proteobacteria bacterium]|nr:GNAT family N-acetyltransferase [Burkholderiales bacterium]
MLKLEQHRSRPASHSLTVGFAHSSGEVEEALRLRYQVFAEELGAQLPTCALGIDQDEFDEYCEHLIARDTATGEVIGTYRVLNPDRARALGRFYSDAEFDLSRLEHLRPRIVEVGRSCVHPDYRTGGTISMLWSGIARHVLAQRYEFLMGCASIGLADGGVQAAHIYNELRETALSPPEYRVFPRCALPLDSKGLAVVPGKRVAMPPLLKGYVRLGAYVCGEPAWDPDFNTADLLLLLPVSRMTARYANHFLKPLEAAA